MPRKRVCIVTGTRADYGLLYWVMKRIQADNFFELQIIATGMHLSPEFGFTYKVIEEDGFFINEKVEMLLSSDTETGITKSIGLGIIGFADVFHRLKPDLLLVLGDRFEILAAVQAAMVAKLPIAHIAGGDTTEGVIDEAIRHAITKMAHIHFVTNALSNKRVRQMGENPEYVYEVGSPGIDHIKTFQRMERWELEESLMFKFKERNLLVTFHPETLSNQPVEKQFVELLTALERLGPEVGLIITKPNADTHGRILIKMIDEFTANHSNAKAFTSLGQLRYLNCVLHVDMVVGNSSSGLYEVPSFKKPTINIGDRQKGRLQASSVINCLPEANDIIRALQSGFDLDCTDTVNPYGDGESSLRIVKTLKVIKNYRGLLKKRFFEV